MPNSLQSFKADLFKALAHPMRIRSTSCSTLLGASSMNRWVS